MNDNGDIRRRLQEGTVLLFDGAMGTEIQKLSLPDSAWNGKHGCNEILNLTAPGVIRTIHQSYLAAGADIIETNTFGASAAVLSEYGLGTEARAVSKAAALIARDALTGVTDRRCFVAGSLGPGTKLPSLGHAGFDDIYESYMPAVEGLLDGGIDLFLLETCQDPLQIKASLCAIRDAQARRGADLPVAVSVTVETAGTLLVGTEIAAAVSILSSLSVDIIGINCATGPGQMAPHVQELCRSFPGPVMVMPNAGLPENVKGTLVYTMEPEQFAADLKRFIEQFGVNLVGGCCGTSPDHIRALKHAVAGVRPPGRTVDTAPGVASLYRFQELRQEPPPFFVGERANTNGSKQFREYLLAENWDGMVEVGKNQVQSGAHAVDLCVAYAGRDETDDIVRLVPQFALQVPLPLVIDSTSPAAVEAALKRYGGRAIINSINLEDGEARARQVCALARRYGAALIALTIDEEGMAKTAEKKLAVARRLYRIAVDDEGLKPSDMIFDPLTFTLGSGDKSLKTAGIETLRAIELIKKRLPGVFTLLGLSNISFGLSPQSRQVLNSVYLYRAIQAGLDLAIVNVAQIVPVSRIDEADLAAAQNLINNAGSGDALLAFIQHFEKKSPGNAQDGTALEEALTPPERLRKRVIDGSRAGLEDLLEAVLGNTPPAEIINTILIPAMKQVGELFGSGRMQLPFVLQSAEVMKRAVDYLSPRMDRSESALKNSIVLATVKGDVHDIGKNLVDIILSNNGIQVYNLGIRVDIEEMIQKAREVSADAIGMSGLLVKSTQAMKENLEIMKAQGLDIPVLLGGAALTRGYVADVCDPILDSPVIYCEDAFKGLRAMNLLKEGKLSEFNEAEKVRHASRVKPEAATDSDLPEVIAPASIPNPPFWGSRIADSIPPESLFPCLNEKVLFKARWGLRRGSVAPDEFEKIIRDKARPMLRTMKERILREGILAPRAVYGYWPCVSEGDAVLLLDPQDRAAVLGRFHFPRRKKEPRRSIADFFMSRESGHTDVIALQAVTIGPGLDVLVHGLYDLGEYRDYLFYHGLGVELAEALAGILHEVIRNDLAFPRVDTSDPTGTRGLRYSFGFSPCPSLEDNRTLLAILGAGRIGITTVESGEMVPEQSTSAFIVHHPQARYFTIG